MGGLLAYRTIIVTGSKGGVGTTTVALNLSVQLGLHTKKRVALLDFARPFGQISMMLDLEPRFTVLDALERIERLDERILASMFVKHKAGIEILPGPLHAPMKAEQRQRVTLESFARLVDIADRAFDLVVVDIGVVNAAEWALVLRAARLILLVAEPSVLALGLIRSHVPAAATAGIDPERIHFVINRWRQNDNDALAVLEEKHERPIVARLPNDYRQLTEAVTLGIPLIGATKNPLVARYRELAVWVTSETSKVVEDTGIKDQNLVPAS
jgi:pilus assembly protein CpaE